LGQGGPVYPNDGIESSSCRYTWWRNLLYINNFFDMRDGCMPVRLSLYKKKKTSDYLGDLVLGG
jgi:hypothetical protein